MIQGESRQKAAILLAWGVMDEILGCQSDWQVKMKNTINKGTSENGAPRWVSVYPSYHWLIPDMHLFKGDFNKSTRKQPRSLKKWTVISDAVPYPKGNCRFRVILT